MRSVDPAELSDILYELRAKGSSALEVAIKLGVSVKTVYSWINQTRYPHPLQLRKILRLAASAKIALPLTDSIRNTPTKIAVGFPQSR